MIPHTTPPEWPSEIASSRFASSISHDPAGCTVALIGLPDDLGVRLNSGRPGAAQGPRAFRTALAKYGVIDPHDVRLPRVFDAGDVVPAEGGDERALHETHARVTNAVRSILSHGLLPVAIGGGHDLTFPFLRAVAEDAGPLEVVYTDAHLDVRETVGSGMPFRRLLEDRHASLIHPRGINPLVNSEAHTRFALSRGTISREPTLPQLAKPFALSVDLDVLDRAHAPGVSAMNPAGWNVRELEGFVRSCAMSPNLRAMDIMELSPPHDSPDRATARVAAHIFLTFLHAFASR